MILASKSPRRCELLKELGYEFKIKVSNVDETTNELDPIKVVEQLSYKKAMAVFEKDEIIIGSDTIVCLNGEIFGKPKDEVDCFNMLKKLSGNKHFVASGICVIKNEFVTISHDITNVYFKDLSDEEIIDYINTKEPFDKAGGYAIQGEAKKFVEKIEGSKNNVIGLPTEVLSEILKRY